MMPTAGSVPATSCHCQWKGSGLPPLRFGICSGLISKRHPPRARWTGRSDPSSKTWRALGGSTLKRSKAHTTS
eukprot:11675491-Alexandrium_andersonii.AAC.1